MSSEFEFSDDDKLNLWDLAILFGQVPDPQDKPLPREKPAAPPGDQLDIFKD